MVKDFISFLTLTELSNNAQPMLDEHDATNFTENIKTKSNTTLFSRRFAAR